MLESQLPELAICAEEVMLKHLLWTSLQSWGEVTQDLSRTEFSQLDAENLEAVVGQYARTALKIEKGLSPNQVESPPAQAVDKCLKACDTSFTTNESKTWSCAASELGQRTNQPRQHTSCFAACYISNHV